MNTRRDFIRTGARAALVGPLLPTDALSLGVGNETRAHPLRILILGGTAFLGPHMVAYALQRGHSVTTFTRGRTEPTVHRRLFDDVEALVGDRDVGLDALEGRSWDVVIDNSGRRVEWATEAATALRDRVETYVYTSSTGVYYPYLGASIDETTPVAMEVPAGIDEGDAGSYEYGVMKARSEAEVRRIFGEDRAIVVRPTYIMGPGDRTHRFTYWPIRLERGGEVMIPGRADDPVQYIDVRDVAEWMIRLAENQDAGTYNAAGPAAPMGMHRFVHATQAAFSAPTTFVPIDDYDFLFSHRVRFRIPWIPPIGNNYGSARADITRALDHGLTFRPLADSARDIHAWWTSGAVPEEEQARLTGPESVMGREADIIAAWRSR
ncbi:MAG: NAD-dependent epimerase/dehydratase family protein [Gemmatimonadota bacterium]